VIFTLTVDQMLRDNIARQQLYVLLFYPFLLFFYFIGTKFKMDHLIVKSCTFFLAVFTMIAVTVGILVYLREHALNQGQYLVSRHIIFLLPVGIIAVTYLTGIVWEGLKTINWLRILIVVCILKVLIYPIGKIMMRIKGYLLGLHT
jgi:hypothetical protein